MAHHSVFRYYSFFLIICMSSVAHCSFIDNFIDTRNIINRNIVPDITGIDTVSISGVLECPLPPSSRTDQVLPAGINVVFTCDGGRTAIGEAVTDTKGFFKIALNTLQTSLFHPNQCEVCRITVGTAPAACRIYPGHRGALLAPINCRHTVVEQVHGNDHGGYNNNYALQYKAESFYFDPSYNN